MRADPSRRPVPHPVSVRPPKRCSSRTADEARTLQDETIHVQEMVSRLCSTVAIVVSWLLIICCFPWSLLVVVKVSGNDLRSHSLNRSGPHFLLVLK